MLQQVYRWVPDGWYLDFYDFGRDFDSVGDLVPGARDVLAWAKRNGARDGTPIFLNAEGRADVLVNAFWRDPDVRGLAASTRRRYARSLKVWLDFLLALGVRWDRASRLEWAAFKEWRLSIEDNPQHVAPNSFCADQAAIRRFYLWVAGQHGVENPVRLRVLGETAARRTSAALEATPSGIRRADVKWLTPEAFRLWRNVGLRGFTAAGVPSVGWTGLTEDRDVAFAEGLFGTGLRLAEWSSQLTIELPGVVDGLGRGWVASACAKRSVGRPFWVRRRVVQLVRFYLDEGGRPAAVARAQRAGRYEAIKDRWLLQEIGRDGVMRIVDETGRLRDVRVDALTPALRMKLFRQGPGGLEPVWLWLNHNGMPRPKQSWHKTFARANDRVAKALAGPAGPPRLWCRPHMLRHSFAMRWYCIATFVAWQRTDLLTKEEQRDFRNQLGDVWFLLATLLGHHSAETTSDVYLEPFQALQVEQLVALMDADDRAALQRLVETLGHQEPRVLTATRA